MTIHVLLSGELHRDPTPRTSASGKAFVTANVRSQADGETMWASVIAFDTAACEELSRLRAGDAVSVQGRAKLGVYERNGEHKPSLDITANVVTPLKPKPRPRQPRQARTDGRQYDPRSLHGHGGQRQADDLPFNDEILF